MKQMTENSDRFNQILELQLKQPSEQIKHQIDATKYKFKHWKG